MKDKTHHYYSTILTSTLELFTATACKVIPFALGVFFDDCVDDGGICIGCTEFDPIVLIWFEDTTIGSVLITIGEAVEVSGEFTIFEWLISISEDRLFWPIETLFPL